MAENALNYRLQTPVAFFIFRRPETTARVFAEIAKAQPPVLLVVADGPRTGRPGEAEQCTAARAIAAQVDWPCRVLTNYAPTNLGCRQRLSSGLDWVFAQVDEAIILEDDCLPHPTFFRFCEELLRKYRDEPRVMHISGDNFLSGQVVVQDSYYYSSYCHVWGWASWRRAWRYYDVEMQLWRQPGIRQACLRQFRQRNERGFWQRTLDAVSAGQVDTWDYQWSMACLMRGGLAVMPAVNLISNLGFGAAATNTVGNNPSVANLPLAEMQFPLRHPLALEPNRVADAYVSRLFFTRPSLIARVRSRLRIMRQRR
jgi:hypothetical protein